MHRAESTRDIIRFSSLSLSSLSLSSFLLTRRGHSSPHYWLLLSASPPSMRSATAPVSQVRIRMTSAMGLIKIFPSPISPVWAAFTIICTAMLTWSLRQLSNKPFTSLTTYHKQATASYTRKPFLVNVIKPMQILAFFRNQLNRPPPRPSKGCKPAARQPHA